jgi:hypothetical protein
MTYDTVCNIPGTLLISLSDGACAFNLVGGGVLPFAI